jgi:phage terminase large subunit
MTAFVARYRNDPVGFVRNVLKGTPLPWQEKVMKRVAAGARRISIRAGHGVGKSTLCSWLLLWHMLTKYPQKSVCTAPTAGQLYDALFSELKSWVNNLPPYLRELVEVLSDRVFLVSSPEGSFISARTSSADRPEALAGIHSESVLLVVDEASAVPEPVFEAAAGSMSGHTACTILISNPTRNAGLFFMTHHELSSDWEAFHVSCKDNPLVSQDFIKQIAATYGEESNAYRVRVLGEFALRDDDTLIAADLVDAAMVREITVDPSAPMVWGVDVARFGDDRSVLCKRRGSVVYPLKTWRGLDLMSLVGALVNEANVEGKPDEILVDSIGLGSGVADRLRELGFNVRDVNVSESAALNPNANRLRDDLWMQVRDFLRARACTLPNDAEFRQELVSPTYKFTSNGKLQVEAKADLKKRIRKSPDLADALCLTFGSQGAGVGGRAPRWIPGIPLTRNIRRKATLR